MFGEMAPGRPRRRLLALFAVLITRLPTCLAALRFTRYPPANSTIREGEPITLEWESGLNDFYTRIQFLYKNGDIWEIKDRITGSYTDGKSRVSSSLTVMVLPAHLR